MKWTIEEKYDGMLLREYLRNVLRISKNILTSIKYEGGHILVNNHTEDVRYRLSTGDNLRIIFPPEERGFYMQAENIPISIAYEDDHILIINKPSGLVAMPTPHTPNGTIANGILDYYDQKDLSYTVHIVTRLDRETSGLMIVAKHRYIHSLLAIEQQDKNIYREYQAIIRGKMDVKQSVIDLPIGRKDGSIIERTVTETGKRAITNYEVIKEYENCSLVKVVLETGRTHQIRVHFSHIGHPIIGDDLYGEPSKFIQRQALHCYKIRFNHPITKEIIFIKSELPNDMSSLI